MLRASDNYVAEMLVKELDRHFGGPGLTAGGTARVVEELARLGVPVEGIHLNDGSGLDTGNRATCRTLLGALDLSRQPEFSILDSGLAIAGATGTLAKRYKGSPAEIRLAAKTGWINGCAAMVGRIAGAADAAVRPGLQRPVRLAARRRRCRTASSPPSPAACRSSSPPRARLRWRCRPPSTAPRGCSSPTSPGRRASASWAS